MSSKFSLISSLSDSKLGLSINLNSDNELSLELNDSLYRISPIISRVALGKLLEWFSVTSDFYPNLCKAMKSSSEHRFQTSTNSFTIDIKLTHQPHADDNKHLIRIKLGQCVFETAYDGYSELEHAKESLEKVLAQYQANAKANKASVEVQDTLF